MSTAIFSVNNEHLEQLKVLYVCVLPNLYVAILMPSVMI